ncbi:hypothetical protein SAMN02745126_00978 [Enhydrobacter aerosaccus]|uniref:SGNH hydrolase-like domain-containing protein, acetyltransferase AlgX n=1 Tax=Enhydrobacter aerosaccus TaxID=225324 RepID=A0A1T4KHU2_9HYPH|nr:SGNH/GDSL hydrolase family protein [Enhydrobacter aerosaccus]SJZ41917.1 hypothetical protein SAMN02745126_00978 [Enhydrobacter aerosaccus]
MKKTRWFAVVYGLILTVVTLAGIEALASFYVPAWPARALRTIPPVNMDTTMKALTDKPWMGKPFNSWGMNDREHSLAKPADVSFRSVFVGDSFVEFALNPQTLPAAVEERATEHGVKGFEAVNLGISATNPRSYYYRMRDVALALSPDALLVFFFSGNDFMGADAGYGSLIPPLVDESPGGSILGSIMPRTNWLLVNRLRLSEFLRGNKPIPGEFDTLYAIAHGPAADRIPATVEHVKKYYYPDLSEQKLTEILSRGGDRFWAAFEKRPHDEEYLMGWLLNLIVASEVRQDNQATIRTPEDAEKYKADGEISATLSWLQAMQNLAAEHHVPLRVFLIPNASVAPDFVDFWKPWPRYYSWYILTDVWHQKLAQALAHTDVPFVDLRQDFMGVSGTYRMIDAHWTEKGVGIAADHVYSELTAMMAKQKQRSSGAH